MSIVTSPELGARLCKVLHLPENTISFSINFAAERPVIVKCEFIPDLSAIEQDEFVKMVSAWRLEEKLVEET